MAEFKPFEMIMRIEYAGAVVDGNAMQTCFKAKPVSELVRCKDCKHYDGKWCLLLDMVNSDMGDWFCGYGERKTECNKR